MNAHAPQYAVLKLCEPIGNAVKRTVVVTNNHPDSAEHSFLDQPFHGAKRTKITIVLRDEQRGVIRLSQRNEAHCVTQPQCEWLFDEYSKFAFERRLASCRMTIRRRHHDH